MKNERVVWLYEQRMQNRRIPGYVASHVPTTPQKRQTCQIRNKQVTHTKYTTRKPLSRPRAEKTRQQEREEGEEEEEQLQELARVF